MEKLGPATLSQHERDLWQESRIKDLWQVFRIMAEFVEGFETMSRLGPSVSIFGSARTTPGHVYYELARETAAALVRRGFGVITGGGPGIMEAANRGAREAGGSSVGLNIVVPHEQASNEFVDHDKLITFDYFFVRKVMFVKYAQGFIALPGGFGTLDELFEALTLIQTGKSTLFPVVLLGSDFWAGLEGWIREKVLVAGNIAERDMDLVHVCDEPEEAAAFVAAFYREHARAPNF